MMETNATEKITQLSKANTLIWLKQRVTSCFIEEIYVCTVQEWMNNRDSIVCSIKSLFMTKALVVRSSSMKEDGSQFSQAGCFVSVLNVPCEGHFIIKAVETVIDSYRKVGCSDGDQVLIQSQTENVSISGVLFTRQIGTNAPYYVINYDDRTGKTDTVTSGLVGQTVYISHFAGVHVDEKWVGLINTVEEIQGFFVEGSVLDIEFAITEDQRVIIFQVRPLAANKDVRPCDDEFTEHLIKDMSEKFVRYSHCEPHLAGEFTIFGDMPDWNPSEIIGCRPNTLDYTIYSFIVTDQVWHEARSSLGYYDVFPAELMVSFGKKPYIDTRISFNSLTPSDLSLDLRSKLVHYYLNKLRKNPSHQDKVEFNILWTCFDFATLKEIQCLEKEGFTQDEIDEIKYALKRMTNNLLIEWKKLAQQDIQTVHYLTDRSNQVMGFYQQNEKTPWMTLNTAYNILQNCKRYGTFPFSRQARLGFIAKVLMRSLEQAGVIDKRFNELFFRSIQTVASTFNEDAILLGHGQLSEEKFLIKYGHLRSGTYDLNALRYDKFDNISAIYCQSKIKIKSEPFHVTDSVKKSIAGALRDNNLLDNVDDLLDFVRSATKNREFAKFEFTKSLSNALELIAEAGEMLGFDRTELCHVDLSTLMKFRNPEKGDYSYAKKIIQGSIDRHKQEREWYNPVILPPVITGIKDFYVVAPYQAEPNFITMRIIEGEVLRLDDIQRVFRMDLSDSIILLENADPGYDWVFAKHPKGIITKYGGIASHIAIRCAEFGIPAAIGCGELIYDNIREAKRIILDCDKKSIVSSLSV